MAHGTPKTNPFSQLTSSEVSELISLLQKTQIKRVLLGKKVSADMNSTSDQSITINSSNYIIRQILVTNASVSLTTSAGGVYTAASKGGTAIVANTQVYSALTSATKALDLTLNNTDRRTETTIYLSLTTGQGSAATADVYIFGDRLD